jgi:hypothetical protein
MWVCKHCKKNFGFERPTEKANHTRHCSENPTRLASYVKIKDALDNRFADLYGELAEFDVVCYACKTTIVVKERAKQHPLKDKYFCSRNCANSSGGKAKAVKHHPDDIAKYTTVAFRYHKKECVVCGENRIVAVHHLNEDHSDNRPENLVPLCPTHHQYMHSRYKGLIETKVTEYIRQFAGD